MRPLRTIRLIWTFYRSFVFASMLITGFCISRFFTYGFPVFTGILWLKLLSLALIFLFINDRKSKEYYYYSNLGVSKLLLWTTTLCFDLALFLFLIIQTSQFR